MKRAPRKLKSVKGTLNERAVIGRAAIDRREALKDGLASCGQEDLTIHLANTLTQSGSTSLRKIERQESVPKSRELVVDHAVHVSATAEDGTMPSQRNSCEDTLRLLPDSEPPYNNLARSYIALNRLDDANIVLESAKARGIDTWALREARYRLAFLQNDQEAMDEQVRWAVARPEVADFILKDRSETEAYYGRLRKADEFSKQAMKAAVLAAAPDRGGEWASVEALRTAMVGKKTVARELAQKAMSLNPSVRGEPLAALAFAAAGDTSRALELAQQLNRQFPVRTLLQGCELPVIRAQVYLHLGNINSAMQVLEPATQCDLRAVPYFGLYTAYIRGEAYLKAGDSRQAAAQFRKVLEHPGIVGNSINGPLARLQLARAEAMMGDESAARKSYQIFLTLWKDADTEIPIYKEAKVEYAKLR